MGILETVSAAVMPAVLLLAAIPMVSRRRDWFSVFLSGAKEGVSTAGRLLPTMIALTTALSMFQASGAVTFFVALLGEGAAAIGIPAEVLPLALTRPVSGAASTAAYVTLLDAVGADSFQAFVASVLMGSSDTLIYILSVYFSGTAQPGCGPVKHTRHAFPVAAVTAVLCLFLSSAISRLFY